MSINALPPNGSLTVTDSNSGYPNLIWIGNDRELPIYSKQKPERKKPGWWQKVVQSGQNYLIIGAGLCYDFDFDDIKALKSNCYWYEPYEVPKPENFAELGEKHALMGDRLLTQLEPELFAKLTVLIHPVYARILQDWPQSVRPKPNEFGSTVSFFTQTWQRNWWLNQAANNLEFVRASSFIGSDVVVLGAAPNLELVLDYTSLLENSFVIACDTAAGFAVRHKLKVDRFISVDSGRGSFWHFRDTIDELKNIPVLTWLGANRNLFRSDLYKEVYLTTFPWDQWLCENQPQLLTVENPGGNVLTAALSFAFTAGSPRVHLFGAGFGLNFGGASHYRGSAYETLRQATTSRTYRGISANYTIHRSYKNYLTNLDAASVIVYGNQKLVADFGLSNTQEVQSTLDKTDRIQTTALPRLNFCRDLFQQQQTIVWPQIQSALPGNKLHTLKHMITSS